LSSLAAVSSGRSSARKCERRPLCPGRLGPRPPDLEHVAIAEGGPRPALGTRTGQVIGRLGAHDRVVELGVHGRAGPLSSHIPLTVLGSSSSRQ
jgi:hypothetical protein